MEDISCNHSYMAHARFPLFVLNFLDEKDGVISLTFLRRKRLLVFSLLCRMPFVPRYDIDESNMMKN
jgi:hypothetical protein